MSNTNSNHTHIANVAPSDMVDSLGITYDDVFAMMVPLLKSDFNLDLILEWVSSGREDLSYAAYTDCHLELLTGFMMEDASEMKEVDAHLAIILLIKENDRIAQVVAS